MTGCSKERATRADLVLAWQKEGLPGGVAIEYPLDGAVFPMEIPPPTVRWQDPSSRVNTWLVRIGLSGAPPIVETLVTRPQWKPDADEWSAVKRAALDKPVSITVLGAASARLDRLISGAAISIRTSPDPVGAPIFFREVPLPFDHANQYPEKIRYRLGYVSDSIESRVLLDNLPLCGNCHSFSKDGRVLGMDVDYANDKGSYVITALSTRTELTPDKIITWSDYKREDQTLTFGLLSQLSPDGRYVVSTVKDRSIFVGIEENLAYSQLFFPIKGILAVYDRQTGNFDSLSGADDPAYVQSNPAWSPDGDTLFFTRARAYHSKKAEGLTSAVLPREAAAEFLDGQKKFRYDIYKVPFNSGAGGEAVPLVGASNNGKSNYFPKVTPDGKWVVFAQADSFMLLQPDSRLHIVPVAGGEAREMTCNTADMNSWHSFSPNGRWMVFSSKKRGIYTQLWLTHLDAQGNDTPPVLLEHLMTEKMAANIPEFINIAPDKLHALLDRFSEGGNYHYRVAKNLVRYKDLKGALEALNRAVEKQPSNPDVLLERGALMYRMKKSGLALSDFEKVAVVAPDDYRGPFNLALAKEGLGDLDGALAALDKAVALNPTGFDVLAKRASVKLKRKNDKGALADLDKAVALNPNNASLYNLRGDLKRKLNNLEGAMADFGKALEINPNLSAAYLNRGFAHLGQNDLDSARKDLDEAKKRNRNAPLGYVIDALIAFKRSESKKGCRILSSAKKNGYTKGYEAQIDQLYRQGCV